MTQLIIYAGIIAGISIYSIINPILLPVSLINASTTAFSSIWALNGIIPIAVIMECIKLDFWLLFGMLIFKMIFGAIAGKPEMD